MALSAGTPILRGYLSDLDCRWCVIAGAVDDRTPEERGQEVPVCPSLVRCKVYHELFSPILIMMMMMMIIIIIIIKTLHVKMQQNNSLCADYFTFSYTVIIVKHQHAFSHHDQCK